MVITPYLTFVGNCEEAFSFYKSIFNGEITFVGRYKDMPPQQGLKMTPEDGQKIMHISLSIGQERYLMGSDAGGTWAPSISFGNNVTISIAVDTKEEAERIFNALAEGGQITMALADTFWGDYFGTCVDKFRINWMISYNAKQ